MSSQERGSGAREKRWAYVEVMEVVREKERHKSVDNMNLGEKKEGIKYPSKKRR